MQVTIPKSLAKQLGIRPGDAVRFERAGGAVLVKKSTPQATDYEELRDAVEALAKDMQKVRKHIKIAERSIAANLSRHFGS